MHNYDHSGKRTKIPILVILMRWHEGVKFVDIAKEIKKHPVTIQTVCHELGLYRYTETRIKKHNKCVE